MMTARLEAAPFQTLSADSDVLFGTLQPRRQRALENTGLPGLERKLQIPRLYRSSE